MEQLPSITILTNNISLRMIYLRKNKHFHMIVSTPDGLLPCYCNNIRECIIFITNLFDKGTCGLFDLIINYPESTGFKYKKKISEIVGIHDVDASIGKILQKALLIIL